MVKDLSIEVQLKILKELQSRIQEAGNACQENVYCCPKNCRPYWTWRCNDCVAMFEYFNIQLSEPEYGCSPCPCNLVPDMAIPCLDEYIKMLERRQYAL